MLERLCIENIALIDSLEVEFDGGMNVITGETGAGKSIIIDSVKLALGERADKELIKTGESKAFVQAVFFVRSDSVKKLMEEKGVELEDDRLIVSREVTTEKSVCRLNGRIATLTQMKQICSSLVDMYGQHGYQSLLESDKHIEFVDSRAGQSVSELKSRLAKEISALNEIDRRLSGGYKDPQELERRRDELQNEINEINASKLSGGEEEKLRQERARMINAERIHGALGEAFKLLDDGDITAMGNVKQAVSELEDALRYMPSLDKTIEKLNDAYYTIEEVISDISDAQENLVFDPVRQERIEQRLEHIHRLKRKYGETVEDVLAFRDASQTELDEIYKNALFFDKGEKLRADCVKRCYLICKKIASLRRETAAELTAKVTEQLKTLGMKNARFEAVFGEFPAFSDKLSYSVSGFDTCEFMFTANAGEQVKPLRKVASGGELSRVMLAFKSVYADEYDCDTLIFDEIDTGISGKIAQVVGEKMLELSKKHQVICVTHSPQIAALADAHYLVTKTENEKKTTSSINRLETDKRVEEIARIISGDQLTPEALAHAKAMLRE